MAQFDRSLIGLRFSKSSIWPNFSATGHSQNTLPSIKLMKKNKNFRNAGFDLGRVLTRNKNALSLGLHCSIFLYKLSIMILTTLQQYNAKLVAKFSDLTSDLVRMSQGPSDIAVAVSHFSTPN